MWLKNDVFKKSRSSILEWGGKIENGNINVK